MYCIKKYCKQKEITMIIYRVVVFFVEDKKKMDEFDVPNLTGVPHNMSASQLLPTYTIDRSYDAVSGHIHNILQHHYDAVLSHYIETVTASRTVSPPPPKSQSHHHHRGHASTDDLRRLQKEHRNLHATTHTALNKMSQALDSVMYVRK